jgi:CubicO group peptidase (beta-lactamase class C family)
MQSRLRAHRSSAALALLLSTSACARHSVPSVAEGTASAADRGRRIVASLPTAVEVTGRAPAPRSLAERMAFYHVPGVSIAIADGGRIVWAQGLGVTTAGSTDSVTTTTLFQAQSISKAITATATLRLVQQGTLDLDADVNQYLTTWKVPENRFTAHEKVTLRRILSHSAGLTVHGFPAYKPGARIPTLLQILDGVSPATNQPVRVDTFPGAITRYSGGGTTVEQLVLMDVTHQPFPELMQRLVLAPLGMTNSSFELPLPPDMQRRVARGHFDDGTPMPPGWSLAPWMAAGGLWTTAGDLVRWAVAIDAARSGKPGAILSRGLATEMLTVQKDEYGLGPEIEGSGRALRFGHGGSNTGYRAQVVYFPATGQGAAVMVNGDGGDFLLDEILRSIAAEYDWPALGPTRVTAAALSDSAIGAIAGRYSIDFPGSGAPSPMRIAIEGEKLYLSAPPIIEHDEVVPVSRTELVSVALGYRVAIEYDSLGQVIGMTLTYGNNTMKILRER